MNDHPPERPPGPLRHMKIRSIWLIRLTPLCLAVALLIADGPAVIGGSVMLLIWSWMAAKWVTLPQAFNSFNVLNQLAALWFIVCGLGFLFWAAVDASGLSGPAESWAQENMVSGAVALACGMFLLRSQRFVARH